MGNTVESLVAKAWVSQPQGCESRRTVPTPHRLQHMGAWDMQLNEKHSGPDSEGKGAGEPALKSLEQESQLDLLLIAALGGLAGTVLESSSW